MPGEGNTTKKRVVPELRIVQAMRPDLPFGSELLGHWYLFEPELRKKELQYQIEHFGLDLLRAHQLSEVLQYEKKYDEARVLLDKVYQQDPGLTAERIGDLEYRCGRYDQARDWYRRAIREGTKNGNVSARLAHALTALKDWKGAEKAYLDGIAEHPNEASLYWDLGAWYQARNRGSDAEAIYRKGCDLPNDISSSFADLRQSDNLIECYRRLAFLLGITGRQSECVKVLQNGIARFSKRHEEVKDDRTRDFVEPDESKLMEYLGERYIASGQRAEAVSLIESELKRRPMTYSRARVLRDLCNKLGMPQTALEVARLAEFTALENRIAAYVDLQLQRMGLYKELFDRLDARRALGDELSAGDYSLFVYRQGPEAIDIIGEGAKKHPQSVLLHTNFMQLLAKAGRKGEAWNEYEKSRDLYFERQTKSDAPVLPAAGPFEVPPLPPAVQALQWYTFLLQEGKDDEFRNLDERLRDLCLKTGASANSLLLPRGRAEFDASRFAAAATSLERCLQEKLWNESATEAMITGWLARSCRALGRRQDAIKWFRRAVEISGGDAGLLSELLCLVAQDEGAKGVQRVLLPYTQRPSADVRLNATVNCFAAWAALAKGDKNVSFENMVRAEPYLSLATQQFVGDDALVNAVILQTVSEKLADSARLASATAFLMRFPAERVRAIKEQFRLPR